MDFSEELKHVMMETTQQGTDAVLLARFRRDILVPLRDHSA
jgi:hypothetical protein